VRNLTTALLVMLIAGSLAAQPDAKGACALKKIGDVIIYQNEKFYSAFPSLVVRKDGEILCAFRRAPDRRKLWGASGYTHTDPNSYLVLVRSKDGGETWTKNPELIYAHPLGGSQDPCMLQLKDGSIVCASYGWAQLPPEGVEKLKKTLSHPPFSFLGGFIVRSDDGGKTWKGPFIPPPMPGSEAQDALGNPVPEFNRGAMMQRADGTLYWAVAVNDGKLNPVTMVHLMTSSDRGETWKYGCPMNETSLIETKKGDILAFIRTAGFDDHLVLSRSTDGGKSFKWEDGKIVGHPYYALKLKDGRIFLIYGYRHEPYGIRARLLNADCTNLAEAPELVIRDDGGSGDLGYPWAALLPDGKILVAYYFNIADGNRFIAGSVIEVD
jgi:sialidase-1